MDDDKRSQHLLREIIKELERIYKLLNKPNRMSIQFIQGDFMSAAAVALNVGQSVSAVPVETNADGSNFVFDPTKIVWSVQDNTVVSQGPNNPDGSVSFTGLKAGSTQVGVADTATGLSAVGVITVNAVTPPEPTNMAIKFGTPA